MKQARVFRVGEVMCDLMRHKSPTRGRDYYLSHTRCIGVAPYGSGRFLRTRQAVPFEKESTDTTGWAEHTRMQPFKD